METKRIKNPVGRCGNAVCEYGNSIANYGKKVLASEILATKVCRTQKKVYLCSHKAKNNILIMGTDA